MVDALFVAVAHTIDQLLKEPPSFFLREFSLDGLSNCSKESNSGESDAYGQGRPGKSRGPVQKYKQALNLGAK